MRYEIITKTTSRERREGGGMVHRFNLALPPPPQKPGEKAPLPNRVEATAALTLLGDDLGKNVGDFFEIS